MIDNKPMEPYRNLLIALLVGAIRDARSCSGEDGPLADSWLQGDPWCIEICNWLEHDHQALISALEDNKATT